MAAADNLSARSSAAGTLGNPPVIESSTLASQATSRNALTVMARIGFGARGLIYLLVGGFALAAAFNLGKQPHGIIDAVQAVTNNGVRLILATVTGVGLACLAAYFAITGLRRCARARGGKHWLFAAGMLGDALIYAAVMIAIVGMLVGWQGDSELETQAWTAWALAQPFGRVLVGIAGLLILACGIGAVIWVMTADIDDDVDLPEDKKRVISPIGRCGLAGRGVAVLIVGVYWISAALHSNPAKAHELGGTLQEVQQHPRGWLLLLTLGIAFAASAVFDFVEALYHRP
jgi:uncharacterized protein DUF1206